jgi:IS4 transposase
METIYLLCEVGENWGTFDVLSWSFDKQFLENIAIAKEWDRYRENIAKQDAAATVRVRYLSPDETEFRRFYVEEVQAQKPFVQKGVAA